MLDKSGKYSRNKTEHFDQYPKSISKLMMLKEIDSAHELMFKMIRLRRKGKKKH